MKIDSLSRISFSDQIGIDHVRDKISKLGYYGEICYNPLENKLITYGDDRNITVKCYKHLIEQGIQL